MIYLLVPVLDVLQVVQLVCCVVSYSNIINEMYCSEVLNKVFFKKKKKKKKGLKSARKAWL